MHTASNRTGVADFSTCERCEREHKNDVAFLR